MKLLVKLIIIFFHFIDDFYHQKRIEKILRSQNIKFKNFLDIGAFKGKYSDLFLRINPDSEGLLFEPQKKYFNFLKEKFKEKKNIEILNIGISNEEKQLSLNINKHEITSTLSTFNKNNNYLKFKAFLFQKNLEKMTVSKEMVSFKTLSKIFIQKNLSTVGLLKIDTEGHEYEVLFGAKEYIKKVNCILIEFHNDNIYQNYNPNSIHDYLTKNNFILKKTFKFPFTAWEDRVYLNNNLS